MTSWKKAAEIKQAEQKFEDLKRPQQQKSIDSSISRWYRSQQLTISRGSTYKPNLYSVGAPKALIIVNYWRWTYTICNMKVYHAFVQKVIIFRRLKYNNCLVGFLFKPNNKIISRFNVPFPVFAILRLDILVFIHLVFCKQHHSNFVPQKESIKEIF